MRKKNNENIKRYDIYLRHRPQIASRWNGNIFMWVGKYNSIDI